MDILAPKIGLPRVATFPASPTKGDAVVLESDGFLYVYNGSAWVARVSGVTKTVDSIVAAAGATLSTWLKSSRGITAGTPPAVSQWDDLSGNNNHAAQATAGSRPSLIGGVIVFDGTDDRLTIPDAASLDPTTDFVVAMRVRPDSLSGSKVWLSKSDSGAGGEWYVQYSGELRFGCGSGVAGNAPSGAFTLSAWHTALAIYRGAGIGNTGRLRWRINGVEQTNTYYSTIPATLTAGTTVVTVSSFSDGAQYFPGAFGEIVLINGALTAQDILDLEDVLTNGPTYGGPSTYDVARRLLMTGS